VWAREGGGGGGGGVREADRPDPSAGKSSVSSYRKCFSPSTVFCHFIHSICNPPPPPILSLPSYTCLLHCRSSLPPLLHHHFHYFPIHHFFVFFVWHCLFMKYFFLQRWMVHCLSRLPFHLSLLSPSLSAIFFSSLLFKPSIITPLPHSLLSL